MSLVNLRARWMVWMETLRRNWGRALVRFRDNSVMLRARWMACRRRIATCWRMTTTCWRRTAMCWSMVLLRTVILRALMLTFIAMTVRFFRVHEALKLQVKLRTCTIYLSKTGPSFCPRISVSRILTINFSAWIVIFLISLFAWIVIFLISLFTWIVIFLITLFTGIVMFLINLSDFNLRSWISFLVIFSTLIAIRLPMSPTFSPRTVMLLIINVTFLDQATRSLVIFFR